MKPPNHGRRVRVTNPHGFWWTGHQVYTPASRRVPYLDRSGLCLLVDDGASFHDVLCILRGDRIELLP